VIDNGVEIPSRQVRLKKRRFVLAAGRICPEKGFHIALDAASRAHVPLLLAGQVFPYAAHVQYFHREIRPRLNNGHRFLGPLGVERKSRFLSNARCLLAPSLVPETSSLIAMEALAAGTPMIAFRAGALAEIIEDGKTGFLVDSEKEMAEAIHATNQLNPEDCRNAAIQRFSAARMIDRYLSLYSELKAGRHPSLCLERSP
jgi:glycosyltransferase involved in cell wall biosynthesis